MNKTKLGIVFGLTTALGFLSGCGETTSDTQTTSNNSTSTTLQGSVFKGAIDGAVVQVTDAKGVVLATGQSQQGSFNISDVPISGEKIVFIKSFGGSYVDEATGKITNPGVNSGLMSVLNNNELQSLARSGQPVSLTPETTLVAKIAEQKLATGMDESQVIRFAENLVSEQLLKDTAPIPGVASDNLMRIGDAASSAPTNQRQALTRNRAASFSYEAENLGLAPEQVFELIDNRATDMLDGTLDGQAGNIPITMVDENGNSVDLDAQKTTYTMARAEVLSDITDRYIMGQTTPNEQADLEAVGMNMALLDQARQQNSQAQANTAANLEATNLPDFASLTILSDEDGDTGNAAGTYTLSPMENVNVTINSPAGSWVTPMLRYNGLQHAPVIVARRGDVMKLTLDNQLKEDSTIHWHGFKIPGLQDGGPDLPIKTGVSRTYDFTMSQAAAPLWFHPHADGNTATQVYHGLAGAFLLKDDITDALENNNQLPTGDHDIALLVQDRIFGPDDGTGTRPLIYDTAMAMGAGLMGNTILVNDVELPSLKVDTRQYRFRVYNGSNARTYNIALSDSSEFYVVATDGGLLPSPVKTDSVVLSAGERAEIVIDFRTKNVGDKVMLVSKPFSGSQMSMMTSESDSVGTRGQHGTGGPGSGSGGGGSGSGGGMPGGGMTGGDVSAGMFNGAAFDIMRFDVTTTGVTDNVVLYTSLPVNAEINTRLTVADATVNREFVMSMAMGTGGTMGAMQFVINGKSFDIERIDELVRTNGVGVTEIWTIRNASMVAHPFHAHAIQWQILDRNNVPASGIDLGWTDTVLVQPGETVRFIGRFEPVINSGMYMYHCHILEHEDTGMMGTFFVE